MTLILLFFIPLQAALYHMPPFCPAILRVMDSHPEPLEPLRAERTLSLNTPQAIGFVKNEIKTLLATDGKEQLFDRDRACIPCTLVTQTALRRMEISTHRWEVNHTSELRVNGVPTMTVHLHYFLTMAANRDHREIIVDPTYLQFLRPDFRANHPAIFTGTREDLVEFFRANIFALRRNGGLNEQANEQIDPEEFVTLTYGFGAPPRNRQLR